MVLFNSSKPIVDIREIEPAIVQITMQDRAHKNTFTKELVTALKEAFRFIEEKSDYKVVVLTGYDNYFASGGTQETLLQIHEKKAKFTDFNVYSLSLDCSIPVISAMQGHGIGGGFVMGLFADFTVLSKESVYTTNFMKYGFTPGMGATYILPKKLGIGLSEELLFTGKNYRGIELEKRGIPFPVLPRKDVLNYALQLSREIADKPRISLTTLKQHMVSTIRDDLPGFIERELVMHEKTIHEAEVKQRISDLFGS